MVLEGSKEWLQLGAVQEGQEGKSPLHRQWKAGGKGAQPLKCGAAGSRQLLQGWGGVHM